MKISVKVEACVCVVLVDEVVAGVKSDFPFVRSIDRTRQRQSGRFVCLVACQDNNVCGQTRIGGRNVEIPGNRKIYDIRKNFVVVDKGRIGQLCGRDTLLYVVRIVGFLVEVPGQRKIPLRGLASEKSVFFVPQKFLCYTVVGIQNIWGKRSGVVDNDPIEQSRPYRQT